MRIVKCERVLTQICKNHRGPGGWPSAVQWLCAEATPRYAFPRQLLRRRAGLISDK